MPLKNKGAGRSRALIYERRRRHTAAHEYSSLVNSPLLNQTKRKVHLMGERCTCGSRNLQCATSDLHDVLFVVLL
jgi:hypothetical protein